MAKKTNRRRFLTALMTGITGAAVTPAAQAALPARLESNDVPKSQGYRESAHIRRYYASTSMKD